MGVKSMGNTYLIVTCNHSEEARVVVDLLEDVEAFTTLTKVFWLSKVISSEKEPAKIDGLDIVRRNEA